MNNKSTRDAGFEATESEGQPAAAPREAGRRGARRSMGRKRVSSPLNEAGGGPQDPSQAVRERVAEMNVLVVGELDSPVRSLFDSLREAGVKAEMLMDRLLVDSAILKHRCAVVVVSYEDEAAGGIALIKRLRAAGDNRPFLMICPGAGATARIKAFKAGADDCLTRPFEMEEFVLRVRSLMRRASSGTAPVLHVRDLALDTLRRTARRSNRRIELTTREFRLLEFLMRSAGRACSRGAISDAVWEGELTSDSNLIEVYVQRLRNKIEVDMEPRLLHSIRGVGYVMRCGQHHISDTHCRYTMCVAASN